MLRMDIGFLVEMIMAIVEVRICPLGWLEILTGSQVKPPFHIRFRIPMLPTSLPKGARAV